MRIIGLALAVVVAAVSPSLAFAADKGASKEQIAKGMAAAPALVAASGSDCQVSDARFVGEATDAKTKAKTTLYEVACKGEEGLLVQQVSGEAAPTDFTCLEAASAAAGSKGGMQCVLPENADPKAGIAPFVARAGVTCTPDKIRAIGHSNTTVFFELACHEGPPGYILEISSPPRLDKPVKANPCIMYDPANNVHCELTDRAAQFGIVDKMVAASGKPCDIKDRSFIGVVTETKTSYYEVACKDGSGYVLQQAASGAFVRAIPCADADAIAGGCKLTDSRKAKTEQAGVYTGFAKKAGFDCNVSGYATLPGDLPGKEVVELTCSNRPDGGIGIFGATSATPGVVYDCAHSELIGYRCALTKASAAYPKLTADLRTLGKPSCTVSNARFVGVGQDKHGYIEVACADGLPGFMVEYTTSPVAPKSTLVCAIAKGIGGGCTLPGNKK